MENIPEHQFLKYHSNTLEVVRSEFNLDKPGAMADSIRILREWLEKQDHFKKKDFSDFYLETSILFCKGSVERSKAHLDRLCTMITLFPQFFGVFNVRTDLGNLFDTITAVYLPKLTPEHYRVFFVRANNIHLLKDLSDYYNYVRIISEYARAHERCRGYYIILDYTNLNIMDLLSKMNVVEMRQSSALIIEGYGVRMKGLHIFTPSKLVDSFVTILKQMFSSKMGSRVYSHKSLDVLPDIVPLDVLPEDYGGKERLLRTIFEEWIDTLSTKENIDYFKEMSLAGTDESRRKPHKFNEQYAGIPGTFRHLSLD